MNHVDNRQEALVQLLRSRQFEEAEKGAVAEIRKAPLFPQNWVFLGESLLHQSFGYAARKAFRRAWLLDPQASWVTGVEQKLSSISSGEVRSDIDQLLQVKKVTVTAGIIAKDEERCIARCLASLQGAVDEIVLVDCGSTDRTVEIAASFAGVKIVRTGWKDDFAALRNEGLSYVGTDWVLWIDADEQLHPDDAEAVREAAALYDEMDPPPILYIWQMNHILGGVKSDYSQARFFPTRYGFRFRGRVHEQIGPAEGDFYQYRTFRRPVRLRLLHDGYNPDIVKKKDKINRNLKLLEMMIREEPDNPGWWTFYGRESMAAGKLEQALQGLDEAERRGRNIPSFGRMLDIHMFTARIRIMREEWASAEEACRKALNLHPDFPDALFYLAMIRMKQGNELYREAEKFIRESKSGFGSYRGTVSPDTEIMDWKADVLIADLIRSTGKFGDAANYYSNIAQKYPHAVQLKKPIELIDEQLEKLQKSGYLQNHSNKP